jgi:hypothetical protein
MIQDWNAEQAKKARGQGWLLAEVWDGRLLLEVLRDDASNIFTTDAAARAFVLARAQAAARDELCAQALRLVFASRLAAARA